MQKHKYSHALDHSIKLFVNCKQIRIRQIAIFLTIFSILFYKKQLDIVIKALYNSIRKLVNANLCEFQFPFRNSSRESVFFNRDRLAHDNFILNQVPPWYSGIMF